MEKSKKSKQIKQMIESENGVKTTDEKDLLVKELNEASKYYVEKNSTVRIKSVFAQEGFFYPTDEEKYKLKHDFIVHTVGVATEKKDVDFQNYLKDVAKKFDEKLNGNLNDSLFLAVVTAYPELLSKSDLKWMVDNVRGKEEKFLPLCNFLICYINPEKEPNVIAKDAITSVDIQKRFNFIWEIFKAIKYYGEDWSGIGEMYLDALFSDDYVSFNIFTTQFFKKRRAKSFLGEVKKYCNKYLKDSRFDLNSSEIYDHFCQVKRAEKKRNIVIGLSTAVGVVAVGVGAMVFMNSVNKNTVELHGNLNDVLIYTHNEQPNLDGLYITYKKYNGQECREDVSYKMLQGIDETKIGIQQAVSITFGGKTFDGLQIRIDPASLTAPTITRQLTNVSWNLVNNASGYEIYVEDNQITQPTGNPKGTVGENVRTFSVADFCKDGQYSYIYVRAVYKDGDTDDSNNLYNNSALSNGIQVRKLAKVSNVQLSGNVLSWDAVENVHGYEVKFGTNKFETTTNSLTYEFSGGEEITISTNNKSEDELDASASFHVLKKVSSVDYDGNEIKCQGETSAYDITITKKGEQTPTFLIGNSSTKNVDVSSFEEGVYEVKVKMHGEGSNISSPETVQYFAIGALTTVEKNGDDAKITWDGSLGERFKVSIDDRFVEDLSTNQYVIKPNDFSKAGTYKVSIVAIDKNDHEIFLKSTKITKLKAPELNFDELAKSWNTVSVSENQAVQYKVNDVQQSSLPTVFTEDVDYKISACIVSSNVTEINSDAAEITLRKLPKPQIKVNYTTDGNVLVVENQPSGTSVKYYYVNGTGKTETNLQNLASGNEYSVFGILSSNGNTSGVVILDSDDGDFIHVRRYDTPTMDEYENGDTVSVGGERSGYTFYYQRVDTGNSYAVLQNGELGALSAGAYSVYAVKNGKFENGIYYLDSSKSQTISVSKASINFTVSLRNNQSVVIKFGDDSDLNLFTYKITYYGDGGSVLSTQSSTEAVDLGATGGRAYSRKISVIDGSAIMKITVEMTMNGVKVEKSWERNQ